MIATKEDEILFTTCSIQYTITYIIYLTIFNSILYYSQLVPYYYYYGHGEY
jgi:hypothetical protein